MLFQSNIQYHGFNVNILIQTVIFKIYSFFFSISIVSKSNETKVRFFTFPDFVLSERKYCTKPYPFAKQYSVVITTKLGTNPGFLSQMCRHSLLIVGIVLPIALREKCESISDIFSIRIDKISN